MYIQDAHPIDLWQLPSNVTDGVLFASARTDDDRTSTAQACVRKPGIRIPALLDPIENPAERAYTAWPGRIYVIGSDGRVTFKSEPGPFGFSTRSLEQALLGLTPGRKPGAAGDGCVLIELDAHPMIGVFDSGFGGLTVHRALIEALPERDFVYLGDNRNAPYGTRPPIEVLNLTCAALERLFAEGCTLAVIACNTASVVALRWIQQQWLPVRRREDGIARNVIGIAVPTIEAATSRASDSSGPIAVFATQRTVDSGVYPLEIHKRQPGRAVVQQACPELAGAIESGAAPERLRALVHYYVEQMMDRAGSPPESVILACTHYPLVAAYFAEALPAGARMIHQPEAVAQALRSYLARHPEYDGSSGGARRFLSTGFVAEAIPLIERFWGGKVPFEAV